jgi:hypothetical protein
MVDGSQFKAIVSNFAPAAVTLKTDIEPWLAEEEAERGDVKAGPAGALLHHRRA